MLNSKRLLLLLLAAVLTLPFVASCGGDGDETASPTPEAPPTASPTPPPPDPDAAVATFEEFVRAVQAEDVEEAWTLYTASIPGSTDVHNAAFGCSFSNFTFEAIGMRQMFDRLAPFTVLETFGAAPGSRMIEARVRSKDGYDFLATMTRVEPVERYRVQFFNSGQVSQVPGAPDPQPSPGDPTGGCGIWTGAR